MRIKKSEQSHIDVLKDQWAPCLAAALAAKATKALSFLKKPALQHTAFRKSAMRHLQRPLRLRSVVTTRTFTRTKIQGDR